jgi:hypothetical protein
MFCNEDEEVEKILKKLELNEDDFARVFQLFENALTHKDRLSALTHYLMLKNGLSWSRSVKMEQKKDDNNFNILNYNTIGRLPEAASLSSNVTLSLLQSGKTRINLQLKFGQFKTVFLAVELNSKISWNTYFENFKIEFLNKLLLPFKFHLKSNLQCELELREYLSKNDPSQVFPVGLLDLPNELLVYKIILKYLNYKSICALGATCKHLNRAVDELWKLLLKRDYPNEFQSLAPTANFKLDYSKMVKRNKRRNWWI